MIHFVCICGEPFDVPAEMAGESLQCPACRRLVDVPLLGQSDSFNDDGTVRMADANRTPSALGDKFRAFGHGQDMRNDLDTFLRAGTGDPATTPKARSTPRYDPVSGELMLPVEIANDDLPAAMPIDIGAPVLGYARKAPKETRAPEDDIGWWTVPWRLLGGMNLMAMTVVYVMHAVMYLPMLLPGFNILWLPITTVAFIMIVSHYGNVMEEFGPNHRDRVPPLLRNASFSEDVIQPLFRTGMAGLYAFAPLIIAAIFTPKHTFRDHPWMFYALTSWGMLIFPVAAFVTICGGVLHNLMPRRLLSAVTAAPGKLVFGIVTFWLAVSAYVVASSFMEWADVAALQAQVPTQHTMLVYLANITVTFIAYAVAVYLMHLAAAWLGIIYRDHWADLNWVLQRHERVNRTDVMSQLLNRRGRPAADPDAPRPVLPIQPGPRRHSGFEVKL